MSKIAVVYWSGTGNTEEMAEVLKAGILAGGARAETFTPDSFTPDKVEEVRSDWIWVSCHGR